MSPESAILSSVDDATRRIAARLAPLTNYERTRPDRPRFTLETMQALLDRLGRRRPAARLVQIGGSKGKGTTAAWLAGLPYISLMLY